MEAQHLLQSLISTSDDRAMASSSTLPPAKSCSTVINRNYSTNISSSSSSLSNAGIISRIALILVIGTLSIWANHEASKGFAVTVVNDAGDTLAGKCFALFYQSDDKATRIVLSTSKFVENILYSPSDSETSRKKVNHVILRVGMRNLTEGVEVEFSGAESAEFTIILSPSLLMGPRRSHDSAVYAAVQRGMARVWLWNGGGKTPAVVGDAMVESISRLAGYGEEIKELLETRTDDCYNDHGSVTEMARFLSLSERQKPGFLRRLNEGMRNFWDDGMLDVAFGMPGLRLCRSCNSSENRFAVPVDSDQ